MVIETIRLVCSAAGKHDGYGAEEYLGIQPQRPGVDVGQVELNPAIELQVIAALQHPDAGQARPHAQAAPLPRLVLINFRRNRRARTDERHISADDVPKLRQLIDAETPQPATY